MELLLDGRPWLAFMKPHSEQALSFSSQINIFGLTSIRKLALRYPRLVVVSPDFLKITMDLESNLVRDVEMIEPSSERLPS